ncbi:MAG: CBS domain-containing protein [Bdellovibrionota bacterium]
MPIRELINDRLQCCSPEMNVFEATRVMKRYDVGCVVIVEDGKQVGIVTDRDIVLRCVS